MEGGGTSLIRSTAMMATSVADGRRRAEGRSFQGHVDARSIDRSTVDARPKQLAGFDDFDGDRRRGGGLNLCFVSGRYPPRFDALSRGLIRCSQSADTNNTYVAIYPTL